MSDKRVSEMTDDQVRDLAGAVGTWKPDAYYEARQAIVNDARAQGKELITRKAWPGAYSDITYAEPLEGIRIALTRASAARRAVDDYVKIAREEGRTWAQVGEALGLAETAADRSVPLAEAAFEHVVPLRDSFRFDTPSFGWHCRSCGGFVSDRGPYESHPEDNEHGHAQGCARMAERVAAHDAEIAEWESWHGDGDDPDAEPGGGGPVLQDDGAPVHGDGWYEADRGDPEPEVQ
jgi:hypothetical protein